MNSSVADYNLWESTVRRSLLVLAVTVFSVTAMIQPAGATHTWGNYHWARTSNPFTLTLGDNMSSAWDPYLQMASDDWSADIAGNPVNTRVAAGMTTPRKCRAVTGRIEVCNAAYGNNGWLGVANVWLSSGGHITKATTKMNDTYYNTTKYNTPTWRAAVVCQELGHTFGLDHQDESGADFHTCMDYASNPDADNMHPNTHDYEQLTMIYSHFDSTSTIGSAAASAGRSPVADSHRAGRSKFVTRYADGSMKIRFVVWVK